MNKALLPALLGGLLLVAVVLDVGFAQDGPAQDDHVAAMFSKRCASCHTVPDVRFATDRAWMDRLLVTA